MRRWAKALLICAAVVALCLLLAACDQNVAGDYVTSDPGHAGVNLSLQADGTCVLTFPEPLSQMTVEGTYTVDGDKVTLTAPNGTIGPGTSKDDVLTLDGVTWHRQ